MKHHPWLSLELIESKSTPEPTTGCWLWVGDMTPNGYGRIERAGERWRVNRAAWLVVNGPIPPGLIICHRCDNPICVNPAHLYAGTPKDNAADMWRRGRGKRRVRNTSPPAPRQREYVGGKLTFEVAQEIKAQPHAKASELAAKYGVSRAAINQLRAGKTWRDGVRYAPGRRRAAPSLSAVANADGFEAAYGGER